MSEELLQEEAQTMADFEEHFDDANPWNLVTLAVTLVRYVDLLPE